MSNGRSNPILSNLVPAIAGVVSDQGVNSVPGRNHNMTIDLSAYQLQQLQYSQQPQPTVHPMCTRSKSGIFKPKVLLLEITTPPDTEPDSVAEALKSSIWRTSME